MKKFWFFLYRRLYHATDYCEKRILPYCPENASTIIVADGIEYPSNNIRWEIVHDKLVGYLAK